MKKHYFSLVSILFFFVANAQIVNIPDVYFKAKLLEASPTNTIASTETPVYNTITNEWSVSNYHTIDTNGDGDIQVIEAQAIKYLDVSSFDVSSSILSLTGVETFMNLKYLNCRYNSFINLNDVSGLTNLQGLDCYSIQLTSLNVSGLTNLQTLNCRNNQLTSLNISGLTNLQILNCNSNQLNNLNVSGLTNLQTLNCGNNQLTSLNVSGLTNLQNLYCYDNQLTSLDISSLASLIKLHYSGNNILFSSFDSTIVTNLISLSCANTGLNSIDISGLTNLQYFYCASNQLTSLDVAQNSALSVLNCNNNLITSLDVSMLNLGELNCSNNMIVDLNIGDSLNLPKLYCNNNNIVSLNLNGTGYLQNEPYVTLDISNNQLQYLYFKNGLNDYYGLLNSIDLSNNPNLEYVCTDEQELILMQQIINNLGYTNCHVNSYCSFTPGGTFYTINGNNRFDVNNNGCDTGDIAYPNLKYIISNGTTSGTLISNDSGNYSIPVQSGIHTISPQIENPTYFNISPTSVTIDFPTQASPFTQDFCVTPNGEHHDLEVTVIPLGVELPGFDASYNIVYKNKGNQLENPTLTFAFDDNVMDFLSASTTPNSTSIGFLSWNTGSIAPFQSGSITVSFNLNSPMETPALNVGDILSYAVTVNGLFTDETPTDNTFALNQTVVNSFDPNDKTCLEGETINPTMIGEYVHYQIRFENTGTFPAQNIVVKDMIDTTKFDLSTLQMVSTSHSCYTRINGNKVEFIFENINLPFDDATNDGYVVFKIKTLPTLTVNSTISNTAEIYFDYNFPIVTNTATSTYQVLANQDFDFENEFVLYPNPAKSTVTISAKNNTKITSVEVYNTLGQLVIAKPNFTETIDVSNLTTETYFVKVNTEKGSGTTKFIKE